MATLEKIRNRAGVLVALVIGFALLAFILGDLLTTGRSIFSSNQFEIAEIDGKSISVQYYQQKVDNLAEIYRMNTGKGSLDESTLESVREQTWQQMVQEYVLEDEVDELGLAVSPEEVFDMVQGANIHPIIARMFTNPETGELNRSYILQFLKSLDQDATGEQKTFWLYLENEITRERMMSKFNTLIDKGLYVTQVQAKENYKANNKKVDFNFIMQRYSEVSDSLVKVTDSDLKAYYKENKNNFKQEASRDIEYVAFDIKPSKEDDNQVREWIYDIQGDFKKASDDKQFVNLNSDEPFDEKYYNKSELPDEYAEFMFNANEGDIYGPFKSDDTYKIAKLTNIKYMPDSVKARHILIQPSAQTQAAIAKARDLADSLKTLIKKGADFAELAKEYSSDGSASEGGELGWFRRDRMVKPFSDSAFNANKGELVTAETQYGIHLIQVQDKAADEKMVQVAVLHRNVDPGSATYQDIYAQASEFAGRNTSREEFEKAAAEKQLTPRVANNLKEIDNRIVGLDSPRELVRWAFEADENEVSKVFELGDKFVVATVTDIREKGIAPIKDVLPQIRLEVTKNKKAEYIKENLNKLAGSSNDLNEIAGKLNSKVLQASNITFNTYSVTNAGIEPALVGAAIASNKDDITKPVDGNNGVYLLKITEVQEAQVPANLLADRNRLESTYSSRAGFEAFEALKSLAGIEDKRAKFY